MISQIIAVADKTAKETREREKKSRKYSFLAFDSTTHKEKSVNLRIIFRLLSLISCFIHKFLSKSDKKGGGEQKNCAFNFSSSLLTYFFSVVVVGGNLSLGRH